MSMKVFITGASGFIGTYIIPQLIEEGNEVIAFDIAPMPDHLNGYGSDLTYIRGDLANEIDIFKAIAQSEPTHILHMGSILAGPCEQNPRRGYAINFNSTLALLDAGTQFGVKRFVMTSSIAVFGRGLDEPVEDDAEMVPETIYGQTKLACEHLMNWYNRKGLISAGAVRFPWVFGPGRTNGITALWSSLLLDKIAAKEKLIIENPEEKGNWLYVKDAVKALILMLNTDKQKEIGYNIMGENYTIREVMDIAQQIEPDADIVFSPKAGSASPYPSSYGDSRARKELGWRNDFSIEAAVRDHIAVYRKKHDIR